METVGCEVGITMGFLFGYERRSGPLVFYYQFGHRRVLFVRNSYHDHYSNLAEGHCQVNTNQITSTSLENSFWCIYLFRYNQDDSNDETLEESGWKLVHGDVFRPPRHPKLFAAIIGSGIQILCMAVITLCKLTRLLQFLFDQFNEFETFQSSPVWVCCPRPLAEHWWLRRFFFTSSWVWLLAISLEGCTRRWRAKNGKRLHFMWVWKKIVTCSY